ncbi:MAG: right-handed parallel beta-helix repeat-containing protein, partial [Janthinobacterium lividum]
MTTLTVGSGQTYSTIAAAVAAAGSGDTINVQAGTYTNDFITVRTSLTIQAVGGAVNMVATAQPPNGKAIITEGAAGINVTLSGLTLSGATVPDGNGAGVRYEGGSLTMNGMTVRGNQDGLLGNSDANGSITINNSTFTGNGAGDGYTHNIYVGAINSFTLTNSTITDAKVGHDVKSRAANNVITGNVITDTSGTASYEIDLPNG